MKKFIKISLLLFLWAICIPVFAAPHSVHELVPVGESATVDTDMFTYNEISFVPTVPGKDFGKINIASVLNKSGKLTPISIDILLFAIWLLYTYMLRYPFDKNQQFSQRKSLLESYENLTILHPFSNRFNFSSHICSFR